MILMFKLPWFSLTVVWIIFSRKNHKDSDMFSEHCSQENQLKNLFSTLLLKNVSAANEVTLKFHKWVIQSPSKSFLQIKLFRANRNAVIQSAIQRQEINAQRSYLHQKKKSKKFNYWWRNWSFTNNFFLWNGSKGWKIGFKF